MIIGLLKPDAGSLILDGQRYDPRNPEMRSRFGLVPQELAIYPELTAIQNLRLFGRLNGLRGRRLKERVDYVLEVTGLDRNAHQTLKTYSGGMSRRLNFGIALLHEPRFVVLDEPTVGIDPQSRARLRDAVRELSKNGVGVLYASHYMEEVQAVCHRVTIIDRGRLLKVGTFDQLLDRTEVEPCLTVAATPAGNRHRTPGRCRCASGARWNDEHFGSRERQSRSNVGSRPPAHGPGASGTLEDSVAGDQDARD